MLKIKQYVCAKSLQEAYELNQNRNNIIIGGMLWLRLQDRNINTAIDISELGLDYIEETDDEFVIGAMTSLRQLENHKALNDMCGQAVKEAVRHIVGVQFRNLATVGGSIFGRYGFSDVLTVFVALGARVRLFNAGEIGIEEFAGMKADNDILVSVVVPKQTMKSSYKSIRNSKTDFPVLTCAATHDETEYRVVIGARPHMAVCFRDANGILENGIDENSAQAFAQYVMDNVVTESNNRASLEYRKKMAGVLTKRALLDIGGVCDGN